MLGVMVLSEQGKGVGVMVLSEQGKGVRCNGAIRAMERC